MVRGSDPLNHNIVTQGEVNNCLQHIDESKKEQFLNVIGDTQIILDEPIYDDSINGASIHAIYTLTVTRKGRKESLKFQYIGQTSIDFNKTPMGYHDESDAIIESYNILERDIPTLHRILGLRNYFLPQDFSYKMAIEHINKLRQMFSKDEILVFPNK